MGWILKAERFPVMGDEGEVWRVRVMRHVLFESTFRIFFADNI